VDDFSSKLDLPSALETVESIDANHMQMARCSSKGDSCYRAISGVLRQFVRQELPKEINLPDPGKHSRKLLEKYCRVMMNAYLILPAHKPPFIVPFAKDDSFIGREDILADIDVINKQASLPRHTRVALVGLGGVG
jgi:hypothetical protein